MVRGDSCRRLSRHAPPQRPEGRCRRPDARRPQCSTRRPLVDLLRQPELLLRYREREGMRTRRTMEERDVRAAVSLRRRSARRARSIRCRAPVSDRDSASLPPSGVGLFLESSSMDAPRLCAPTIPSGTALNGSAVESLPGVRDPAHPKTATRSPGSRPRSPPFQAPRSARPRPSPPVPGPSAR